MRISSFIPGMSIYPSQWPERDGTLSDRRDEEDIINAIHRKIKR